MIRKLVAAAVLTAAATAVTAATASGAPAVAQQPAFSGVDRGVQYAAAVAPDHSAATLTLASGKFELTPTGITVVAPDGAVLASVPTTLQTAAGTVQVVPEVDAAASQLTLTPVNAPAPQPALQNIGDAGTTVAGVLIGCAVGALIGFLFFFVGFAPGCLIGGIIGGIVGANQ
ncbi:hypothetical protein [Nocardia sp. XZ_19_385]